MAPCSPVVSDQPAFWHLDAARGPSTPSLDHLVGAGKQRRWDFEAQRPRGLEVDDQLELSWLHDRQIAGLLAPEYPIDIRRCVSEQIRDIHAIGSQATLGEHKPERIDRGQLEASGQLADQIELSRQ